MGRLLTLFRPAGGFDPISLAPALWLDASVGVFTDAGSTPATNGQAVQQWNDLSGNGKHATQATSGKRPTLVASGIGAQPSLSWDGTDDCLQVANLTLSSAFTAFIVFKLTGTAGIIMEHSATAVSNHGFFLHGNGQPINTPSLAVRRSAVSYKVRAANWAVDNAEKIVAIQYNQTHASWLMHINGADQSLTNWDFGTSDLAASNATTTLNIGSRNDGASDRSTGLIAEVLVFSSVLSAGQIAQVEGWLNDKYQIY